MVTNFFRINIPFETFQVQRLEYSSEKLAALRQEHNKDASFFRNGDFIYISPRKGFDPKLGKLTDVKIDNTPGVVLSLIRHLIFRAFRDAFPDRVPESFSPLRFFSTKPEHDAIRNFLPEELQEQISYPIMVEVQARQITEKGRPSFGLLIGSRQRWQFKIDLRNLLEQGFDLVGKSVLESVPIPGLEGVLAPDETLLGEIVSVEREDAEITTNEGIVRRQLDSLHLQRTRQQIGDFLAFKLGSRRPLHCLRIFAKIGRAGNDQMFSFLKRQNLLPGFLETEHNLVNTRTTMVFTLRSV
jgi:hypothetical protein